MRFLSSFILLLLLAGVAVAEDLKVGVIDFQAIFQSYEGFAEAETIFLKDMEAWQSEKQQMLDNLMAAREEYQVQRLMMTPDTQKEKEAELSRMEAELYQFDQDKFSANGEAARRNMELSEPIYEEIREVVKTYCEEEGYDLVLDVSGAVIYQKPEMLLDEQIKTALQAKG
ncbi:MAG: OmpH family outer membrane protein [bacterium]|nr:OmpH family outer membrane protein [bacterium]